MAPNFCPVCGIVKIVPVMRAMLARNGQAEIEPAVLAYKCERGHLFAFDDYNPCESENHRPKRRARIRHKHRLEVSSRAVKPANVKIDL